MDRDQIVKIVDEVVEGLLEGGPGSGRYPEGSGKHPDAENEVKTRRDTEKKLGAIKEHNAKMKKKFDEYDKEINKKTRAR